MRLVLLLLFFEAALFSQNVYVTGDIHGTAEYQRLLNVAGMNENDVLIVLGDFGLVWDGGKAEKNALSELENQPYVILFIDGNHENFDMLEQFPQKKLFGGNVRTIAKNVFWLQRGEIYTIFGKTFFTFGGGYSADFEYRIPKKSWWQQETATEAEKNNALFNVQLHNNTVNYILTHVPYYSLQVKLADYWVKTYPNRAPVHPEPDPTARFLDTIKNTVQYDFWYNGHFHFTGQMDEKQSFVYREIIKLSM